MKRLFILLFAGISFAFTGFSQSAQMPVIVTPAFKNDTVNISRFGAVPDGHFLNTKNINAAIDAVEKKGGGVVLVSEGLWLTGPIVLKNNVNLHLATGATLLFTKDFNEYPLVKANWEGLPQMRNQSPISATNATNIAITGNGIIDGNGDAWRMVKKEKLTESQWKKLVASGGVLSDDKKIWYPTEQSAKGSKIKNPGVITPEKDAAFYAGIKDFLRPNMVVFTSCKNILLEGVIFQNSPAWCLHPLMCEDLTVRNVTVKNPWYAQNGDGIDVESCKNVLIENSVFDVGDDALCMKSGRDAAGRKRGMPTENVIIRGCTVYAAHGGFVVGSEMSGGAKNIHVSNCTFIGTDIGLRFKTTRGRGGVVEDIFINNINMKDIRGEAILFDMYYEAKDPIPLTGEKNGSVSAGLPKVELKPVDETTPVFKNFYISNVYVNGAEKAIFVRGLPEMHVKDIVLKNMVLQSNQGIDVQEATGIKFKNINVISQETNPVINIIQSDSLAFENIRFKKGSDVLFRINGDRCHDISIRRTNAANAKKGIEFASGAKENSTTFISFYSADNNWAERIAKTVMRIWPDSFALGGGPARWSYDMGVILKGFETLWRNTGDAAYFNYIQKQMDVFVNEDGSMNKYSPDEYNIDHINNGKLLLLLYRVTGKDKYLKAANLLREQLRNHPRTNEGGFWHKQIYPYQMWLDGLYMGEPFYAEYADLMHEDTAFNDVANQFIWMEKHARDSKTGLLYHAWDESKQQKWANKVTGTSPLFWGRAMGWYATALVDVLDWFPANHPKRKSLVAILNRLVNAIEKVQDTKTGLWLDVLDYNGPGKEKNYFEASSSCQFVYAVAKGVRKGYLPASKISIAKKGYDGIIKHFIKIEELPDGREQTDLTGTVKVSGLGGKPYRDGSFEYYMSEPVVVNSGIGLGAFLLASTEMDLLPTQSAGKGKTVLLDYFFNNEWKKDATGTMIRWHYTWEDQSNGGYSILGDIFNRYGMQTKSLTTSPTSKNLKGASIYIIVDPDTDKETEKPNYVNQKEITSISNWVKAGGILVLLSNDAGNAEFTHFNQLAGKFGIQFNEDSKNHVEGRHFEQGAVFTPAGNVIFNAPKKLYIKELSTLQVQPPAEAVLKKGNDNLMAVARYGKGTVFALGDPWIYNEYVDGRKLPADFKNYAGAEEWVKWLIRQVKQ